MVNPLRRIKIVGKNRYELYLSILIVLAGVQQSLVLPHGYEDRLILAGSLLLGLICALNAVMDYQRMSVVERIIGAAWFTLLLVITPVVIWQVAHHGVFADR